MTRKRFVKLLMSYGIPRNRAMAIAYIINEHNVPYSKAFHSLGIAKYRIISECKRCLVAVSQAVVNASEVFRRLGFALKEVGGLNEESQ